MQFKSSYSFNPKVTIFPYDIPHPLKSKLHNPYLKNININTKILR